MTRGVRRLLVLGSEVLSRTTMRHLQSMRGTQEFDHAVHYALIAALEMEYDRMRKFTSEVHLLGSHVLYVQHKLVRVPGKIAHFKATGSEQDLQTALIALRQVKEELAHV